MVAGIGLPCDAMDAMSELPDVGNMLGEAERAATAGDFASADELLREAARIQEAELGSLHPDLANTLNNLAVVAEKAGRPGDAETFYRKAVAIASASLPVDHPMVAASRQNLEDFCRARGLQIDAADVPAAQGTEPGPSAHEVVAVEAKTPSVSHPLPRASRKASRSTAWIAIGVVVLATAALFVRPPWSTRELSTPSPVAEPTAPHAAEPAQPPPAMPARIEQAPPPKVVPRQSDRGVVADTPPAPGRSSGAITLASVQLCRRLSTDGADWRCDPAGDPVAPGPIVLYSRVRSPRDAVVVHRWYRGGTLRQSVKLSVRASATEGYRTYSRQTVGAGGEWRVEVRSAAGDLLHEQRFAVR